MNHRNAFTLVEMLVTIVILGIISGMLSIAMAGAQRRSRETQTRGLIDRLNLIVLELYEQESERRVTIPSKSYSARERNRTQLLWKRDWLRASLPDRISDIDIDLSEPAADPRRSKPIQHIRLDPPPPTGTTPVAVREFIDIAIAPNGTSRDRRSRRYQTRIIRTYIALGRIDPTAGATDTFNEQWNAVVSSLWSPAHQSSECLYLILATHTINGLPASDTLSERDVADTDGDGMPEIIDGWGTPVAFMRWPVGYYLTPRWNDPPVSPAEQPTVRAAWAELAELKREMGRETLDLLYSDSRYASPTTVAVNHEADDPFPVVPVVISAGSDRAFDLVGIDVPTTHNYKAMFDPPPAVPQAPNLPPPAPTYTSTFFAVDPFLSQNDGSYTSIGLQLGARMDTNGSGTDNAGDNVEPALNFER